MVGFTASLEDPMPSKQSSVRLRVFVRTTAAAALLASSLLAVMIVPVMAEPSLEPSQLAAVPAFELRVYDRESSLPLRGVRLQSVSQEFVAVTNAQGRALIPARFAAEPVLTLEHEGYPLVLLEGNKLTARAVITLKHFSERAPQLSKL
jgi:hypothetical protein